MSWTPERRAKLAGILRSAAAWAREGAHLLETGGDLADAGDRIRLARFGLEGGEVTELTNISAERLTARAAEHPTPTE